MTRPYRFLSTLSPTSPQTMAESPVNVPEKSEFAIIIVALLCGLVCAVGLIVVAYFTWLQRRSATSQTSGSGQSSANKGIKKKFVEAIPKFAYDSAKEETCKKLSSNDCVICLTEYANGDEIRVLPQCGHGFHVGCIDKWLESHSSCPSCRQMLVINDARRVASLRQFVPEKFCGWWNMKSATVSDA